MGSKSTIYKEARWLIAVCIDCYALSKIVVKNSHPLPQHKDLMDHLRSVKFLKSLDLCIGFFQCCIAEEDILKAAFLTRYQLCKWFVMWMGLINVLVMFILTMNNLFVDMLDKGVVVSLNKVLKYNAMAEEYFKLLEKVFTCLNKHVFYCKLKKCRFLTKKHHLLRV